MSGAGGQRVLVLGGTGYLGRHVMKQLGDRGHHAIALSRATGTDITDHRAFVSAVRDAAPDCILNCAAHVGSVHYVTQRAADVVTDNLQILVNVFRAAHEAAPAARVVHPISNCSYPGDANVHWEPEWEHGPVHDSVLAYGGPRRMIRALAVSYARQHGTRCVNWLIANAYGPGDHLDPNKVHALNGIVMRLVKARRAGEREFVIWGTGRPVREWVYIEDVARVPVESVTLGREQPEPLNLAQNRGWSILEIAQMAARIMDYDVRFTFDTTKPDGAPTKVLDDRAFRRAWPDFAFTPFEEGIRRTVEYYERALPRDGAGDPA